jgi:hypothetical protein
LELEENRGTDRLVELIIHLSGCSTTDARSALAAVGPRAEGLSAVAHALWLLRQRQA